MRRLRRQSDRSQPCPSRLAWPLALAGAVYGAYRWQPLRYDLLPRALPDPHPWTDPDSACLLQPGTRITIVTAHPDDTEFYLGGLLTQLGSAGAQISLIVTTDGDKGYYLFVDAERARYLRRLEQRVAADRWHGGEIVFLGYPDGRLPFNATLIDRIVRELRRLQPDYVLLFDGDYPPRLSHQDHRISGRAAYEAAHQAGVGDWILRFSTRAPNFAIDVTASWEQRLALLPLHASQWHGNRLRMVQQIITNDALEAGRLLGVRYAESFRCERIRRSS